MRKALKYAVPAGIGLIIALTAAWYRGLFSTESAGQRLRALSDGFWIAAVVIGGIGVLSAVSATGFFDMMRYSVGALFSVFWRDLRKGKRARDFLTYKREREGKRRPAWAMVFVGLGFFSVSFVFMILFERGV